MREDYPLFVEAGVEIVAVAPHEAARVREYWQEQALPFIGVADPEGQLAVRYGQQWKLLKLGRMPAQFVLDGRQQVVFAHYAKSMADIPKNAAMLELVRGLPPISS